jgi:hypothetical protein
VERPPRRETCDDWIVAAAILLAGLLTLVFLEPAGQGMLQTSFTPVLAFALAVAGALAGRLRGWTAKALWIASGVQYVLFRGLFLAFNTLTAGADRYNLEIKESAGVCYAVDESGAVLPLAAVVLVLSGWLLIRVLRRGGADVSARPDPAS